MSEAYLEVDEQLRSARLQSMFRKGWPFAAGIVVLALLATLLVWGWRAQRAAAAGESAQRYADAMQALSLNDTAGAQAKFATLARDGSPAYRALSLMQEAGMRLKAGDAQGAARFFDQAGAAAHDPILGDSARLRAAFVLMDTAPYEMIRARLKPLTGDSRPFHVLAREGLAVVDLASGRAAEAKGEFQLLSLTADASDGSRARANAALAMINSGAAGALGAIAHAAVGLKAAPPAPQASLTPEQMAALRAQMQARAAGGAQAAQPGAGAQP